MNTQVVHERQVCVIGDVHGHLQLGLCIAARWQSELKTTFEAVVLCGDIGCFTSDEQLDNATRRHAKVNSCELEFMRVWAKSPQPAWLARLFEPRTLEGLGLECPVVMISGNHEGFAHLAEIVPSAKPSGPVSIESLPTVDSGARIRYLPCGWQCRTRNGLIISGLGGIEPGQRAAKYHPLAYFEQSTINSFEKLPAADLLITHQGPALTQKDGGSAWLDQLLGPALLGSGATAIPSAYRKFRKSEGPRSCPSTISRFIHCETCLKIQDWTVGP